MSGLYSIKPWFVRSLSGIEHRLVAHGIRADVLSYAAVAFSAVAGGALVAGHALDPAFWLLVVPLSIIRLALNALDGAVARRVGTARPFGKVINEVTDRVSDALLFIPLAAFVSPWLVLGAVLVASLVSLCGCLGEVVGRVRLTQGPMGKADRCAVLAVGATVAGLTESRAGFVVALGVIVAGGVLTLVARLRSLHVIAEGADHVR